MATGKEAYWQAQLHLEIWLGSVLAQRDRIIEFAYKDKKMDMDDAQPDFGLVIGQTRDANLLVFALHQLRLTVSLLAQLSDAETKRELTNAIDEFDSSCPHIRDARNILAHFDEYAQGTGRMQKGKDKPGFESSTATHLGDWTGDGGREIFELTVRVNISPTVEPFEVSVNSSTRSAVILYETTKDVS